MSTLEDNRALVHRLIAIVNAGDLEALPEVATGQVAREAARWIGPFRASFPDFRMDVIDVIAEHDKVVGHFRCSGTHRGEWRGHAPTGRRFEDIDEIYIFALDYGRLTTSTAVVEDNLTRLRQLGLPPPR